MNDEQDAFDPKLEHERIRARRALWEHRQPGADALPPEHPVGLAFSGGGIRSATFSLGLAQALAAKKLFPQIDYLSTVSGGGYTGAFLGSLFLPRTADLAVPDPLPRAAPQTTPEPALAAAERAERLLTDPPHATAATVRVGAPGEERTIFHPLRWLRENGRYLTPAGARDLLFMAAFYLRSLIGVHYVLALALTGAVLAVYVVRIGLHVAGQAIGGGVAPRLDGLDWDLAVIGDSLAWWWSPILWLVPLAALAICGPLVLAYWLVFRQESAERLSAEERAIKLGPYWLLVASVVFGVLLARFDRWDNPVVFLLAYGAYLAMATLLVQRFWLARLLAPGEDWTHTSAVARARLKLTQALAAALALLAAVAAAGLVDSFGQTLFVAWLRNRPGELAALASSGGVIAVAAALARRLGEAVGADATAWKRRLARLHALVALVVALAALAAIAALLVAFIQWIVWSPSLAGLRVKPQARLASGHFALLIGVALAWALLAALVRESLGFLNNSTFHRFYCARLVRTFLGAANFRRLARFHEALHTPLANPSDTRALFVSESHPDDEVALRSYYAGSSAGPLHLVCATVNETLSQTSNLVRADRKGVALAVGPVGINVDDRLHRWAQPAHEIGSRLQFADLPAPADTAGADAREDHDRQTRCERLALGAWAAISGAAVSTGLGRMSSKGFSMLAWLVNTRLAYWWLPAARMCTQQRESLLKTFDLVWQELTGGFYGRRGLRWNLSDGGHFENTAVYELLRRRAALIVCADNGADPGYGFSDLQNLVRRARIDFGAEIEFFDEAQLATFVERLGHAQAAHWFGTIEQFRDPARRGDRCALVARVRYAAGADALARAALLVVVKPTVPDFAPVDVKLYARRQPAFPQQSTGDQFFDEGQWESYRRLGEAIGLRLFDLWPGLVREARALAAPAA
ncbi:MAG: patatin-like phospholipase family protein [Pseudomonadota bacterium]